MNSIVGLMESIRKAQFLGISDDIERVKGKYNLNGSLWKKIKRKFHMEKAKYYEEI